MPWLWASKNSAPTTRHLRFLHMRLFSTTRGASTTSSTPVTAHVPRHTTRAFAAQIPVSCTTPRPISPSAITTCPTNWGSRQSGAVSAMPPPSALLPFSKFSKTRMPWTAGGWATRGWTLASCAQMQPAAWWIPHGSLWQQPPPTTSRTWNAASPHGATAAMPCC